MIGDKITYGESIECPGRWRRMDYETTVQDGETVETASNRAQYFVQNFLSQPLNYVPDTNVGNIPQEPEPQSITPQTQEQKIKQLISQATSIPELEQYRLLSLNKKYPFLKEAYDNKLNELTK